jgi:DNA polymerase sigma
VILSHLLLKSNLHEQLLCKMSLMLSNIYGHSARHHTLSPSSLCQIGVNFFGDSHSCVVWQVEVFGSFRTGLYLPTSDIDVSILVSSFYFSSLVLHFICSIVLY